MLIRKKRPLFSILTATHNRPKYLKTLYKSLTKQNFKNFEWVIGNDGSKNDIDKLIRSFAKEKKVKIKYIKSDIRIGKSKIDNLIIPYASGKYFCYCGSDDYFEKNALINTYNLLRNIPKENKKNFGGIVTQSVDTNKISQSFYKNTIPKKNTFMIWEDLRDFVKGDCTILEKSKAYSGKKFKEVDFVINEGTLMHKIHSKKKFLVSPIITKIMRRSKDSISFGKTMRYCRGYAYSIAINYNYRRFESIKSLKKFWIVLNFWRYLFHGDINFFKGKKMWQATNRNHLYCLLIPISMILCVIDILSKKIEKTHQEFEKNKNKAKIEYKTF